MAGKDVNEAEVGGRCASRHDDRNARGYRRRHAMFPILHRLLPLCLLVLVPAACLTPPVFSAAPPVTMAGAKIELADYQGPATFAVRCPGKFRLEIDVTPQSESRPLTLRIELAQSGREMWPVNDVEVRDSAGQALPVRRAGIEWHLLFLTVPAENATYVVRTVEPSGEHPAVFPENRRVAADPLTGLGATVCTWHGDRRAALSIRFDDSHPTHLSKAIPILREHGFRGTFMVNPGAFPAGSRRRSDFQDQLDQWQAVARRGDQELANHTSHHRGAENDDEMEREVGQASEAIWDLLPKNSRLLALNLGGGTWWTTTRTLRDYLDKYCLFDASSGSLGMDDTYGNRLAALDEHLDRHIERGGWCRIHFHSIGEGEASSEVNFREALQRVRQRQADLWIAGITDIFKYQSELAGATLLLEGETPDHAVVKLACSTNPELFDQPLTLRITLPQSWPPDQVAVTTAAGENVPLVRPSAPGDATIRFDAPPATGRFHIRR
ncbi:MAG: polysaccharide deacetylase family protein [Thermoguttaceae bacterium]